MLLPAATGFGDAVLAMLKSALETTFATSVAVSLERFISPPPPTIAVFVTVEGAVCNTLAVTVIEGSLLLPASTVGSTQLTVCEAIEQLHPVPLALVGVRPVGSVSFTVTTPLLAP